MTKPRPARQDIRFPAGANIARAFGHDAQAWAKYQCQSHARIFRKRINVLSKLCLLMQQLTYLMALNKALGFPGSPKTNSINGLKLFCGRRVSRKRVSLRCFGNSN
jgi:hypothetical protein